MRRLTVHSLPLLAFLGLLVACSPSAPPATTSPSVTGPMAHPSDWTVVPAEHDWTMAADAGQSLS